MDQRLVYLLCALAGYLLGSVPFGLLIVKAAGLGDIREIGSKNIGATNVLRTGRKDLAFLTLLFDLGKAALAALSAAYLFVPNTPLAPLVAGFFCVVGHNFPVWLKFKGGKGVAATIGMLAATSFPVGLASSLAWLLTAALFRMSSLAALVALGLSPLFALYFAGRENAICYFLIAVLAFIRHKENIRRLLKGEEPKISLKKSAQ